MYIRNACKTARIYLQCSWTIHQKQGKIQKFKETRDSRYIYRNKLAKACLQHDIAYGDFKDLPIKTASDKVLRDKAFNIAKTPKYDGYQRGLVSMVFKSFDKMTSVGATKHAELASFELSYVTISQIITHINNQEIGKTKSTLAFYRQYLGC